VRHGVWQQFCNDRHVHMFMPVTTYMSVYEQSVQDSYVVFVCKYAIKFLLYAIRHINAILMSHPLVDGAIDCCVWSVVHSECIMYCTVYLCGDVMPAPVYISSSRAL